MADLSGPSPMSAVKLSLRLHSWGTPNVCLDAAANGRRVANSLTALTDPSYRGQILVFTQPLIGNYGVPSNAKDENGLLRYFESPNIQASGVVVADVAQHYSHWQAVESL